jgi:hypothetical protein
MIEVNFQCSPCRPFTKERACSLCLESQLEVLKYKRDIKQLVDSDANEKRDDVFSVFTESELAEADRDVSLN